MALFVVFSVLFLQSEIESGFFLFGGENKNTTRIKWKDIKIILILQRRSHLKVILIHVLSLVVVGVQWRQWGWLVDDEFRHILSIYSSTTKPLHIESQTRSSYANGPDYCPKSNKRKTPQSPKLSMHRMGPVRFWKDTVGYHGIINVY